MKIEGSKWILRSAIGVVFLGAVACFFGFKFFNNNVEGISTEKPIPVAMALDDGYVYPTIVSITSMLENADTDRGYSFYIMHPGEFKQENKDKIKSLEEKYKSCKIELIDMKNAYKGANDKGHITTPAYYRLALSDLLPQLDKIIWIDGDTIVFADLKEMYDIDMSELCYRGFLDDNVNAVDNFVPDNDHVICSGVMLLNLEELRKENMVKKFEKFISENNDKLIQHDQTTINSVAYKKVDILPAKYGIYNYWSLEEAKSQSKVYRYNRGYTSDELESAYLNPVILHCISKPWKSKDVYGGKYWWDYAQKTDFYNEIREKYPIF